MALVGYSELLNRGAPWQTTQGTALNTAATATLSPQGAGSKDFPVPTSYLYPGSVFRLTANGILTTTGTSTTATIFLAAGATPTTLATPAGITTGTTVITGIQWVFTAWATVTAIGSTGNTMTTIGELSLGNSGAAVPANPIALTATPGMQLPAPNSAGDTAAAVDTTTAMTIMMRGTLAGANATIQCNHFLIEHVS